MEGRFRILFLKTTLWMLVLCSLCTENVIAAEGNTRGENYDIGIVLDGENPVNPASSISSEDNSRQKEAELPVNTPINAVPLEANSTQVIQPAIARRKIDVDKIDAENFEVGLFIGLLSTEDFGANMVTGARVAYHITENFFTELAYGLSDTTETSYERLSGGAKLLTAEDRRLTYYNISLGYNLLPGEAYISDDLAFNTSLYIIGGAGITRFAGDDLFTVNIGAGYRFLANDWLALHIDFRDHMFEIDLLGVKKSTNNLEVHGGITVFF